MKIKVVDMTYEQALAQPPQVHKKPKNPSLLFRTVLRAVSAPDLLATHFHCEKIGMAQIKSDEPCLVLMNHSCFLDLKIAEAVLYPRPFNIVCTSDGFVGKEWLMRSVGCIPTRKFCSDTTLVRDMLYCVRTLKTSVLLYPEASYSFDGTATPLPESIGKCVKALNVPVVMIRTYGAFARDPLYNGCKSGARRSQRRCSACSRPATLQKGTSPRSMSASFPPSASTISAGRRKTASPSASRSAPTDSTACSTSARTASPRGKWRAKAHHSFAEAVTRNTA